MLFRNLVLVALALSSGVAAIRTERGSKAEDVNERALHGKCGKDSDEHQEYFNALFEIDDGDDENFGAFCDCVDSDYLEIGEMIRDITEEVDKEFPNLEAAEAQGVKEIESEVCEMPTVWGDEQDTNRRGLRHFARRLGKRRRRFTYKSGGLCRRCKTTTTARLLSELKIHHGRDLEELDPKEMAAEACGFADVIRSAYDTSKRQLEKVIQEMKDMLEETTDEKVLKELEDVDKFAEDMEEELEKMLENVEDADKACSAAQNAADEYDEKDAEDALEDAEKAAEEGMKQEEKVIQSGEDAKEQTMKAKSKVIEEQTKKDKERAKKIIEEVKKAHEEIMKGIEEMIKQLEEEMKDAKSLHDKTEAAEKEAELKIMILQEEAKIDALETAEKDEEEYLKDEVEYNKKLATLLLSAEYAVDYAGTCMQSF